MTETELSPGELRKFAMVTAAMIAVVFGLLLPWLWNAGYPMWPWIGAGLLACWGLVEPTSLARPYRWWMRLALALGWINNRIILGMVFFALFLPIGIMRRLLGGDPMRRRLDPRADSYRIAREREAQIDLRRPY